MQIRLFLGLILNLAILAEMREKQLRHFIAVLVISPMKNYAKRSDVEQAHQYSVRIELRGVSAEVQPRSFLRSLGGGA